MRKLARAITVTTLAAAAAMGRTPDAAGDGMDSCHVSAEAVTRSCRMGARSDRFLQLAKCANLGDSDAMRVCRQEAALARREALEDCEGQGDVREEVCDGLGGAAYEPAINPANFVAVIDNPYFPLTPGTTFIYEGQTPDGLEHSEFAITHNTRVILGVTCVEVRDRVLLDGELREDTLDWFAQDSDGNVWYFGENTHELVDGLITTIDGTFTAGVDGAKPGIIMKAQPAIGDFYRQEYSLANAEDLAEVVSLTEFVTVPAGAYANCLKTQETTPLEPDLLEHKSYAAGVGNVLTVDVNTGSRIELIAITTQ